MPKRKPNTEQKRKLGDDPNVVFPGNPEDFDIEKEIEDSVNTIGVSFDAEKLADILMVVGQRMLGYELYDYQKDPAYRIIYSLLVGDGAEVTMLFARQSGKSEVVAFCANVIAIIFPVLGKIFKELKHFSSGVKMGLIAPQLEQVDTVYSRCMERLLSDSCKRFLTDPDIEDEPLSKVSFKLKSGSYIKAQSGAKQSKIESKTYHIVFIDESQDMNTEKVRKSIIPMTASTFGTIVRLGTPNRYSGDFYHTIKNNKIHDKKLGTKNKKKTQLHFEFDYQRVIKDKERMFRKTGERFHSLYKKAITRDRNSIGELSDEFRMAYKLEWLHEIGMFVTEDVLLAHVYNRRIVLPEFDNTAFNVAGIDIASARASTVITLGRIEEPAEDLGERPVKLVCGWKEIKNTNYDEQFAIVAQYLTENQVRVAYVDYTGVGRAFTDLLLYYLSEDIEIVPYTFHPVSKSDMWKRLEEDILNDRITVPAAKSVRESAEWKEFNTQMLNLQKLWKGKLMVCQKTSGYKDDYCDSLGLMNLAGNHLYDPPQIMEVTPNVLISTHAVRRSIRKNRW